MKKSQLDLFGNKPTDLPLFSGTAQKGKLDLFDASSLNPKQLDFWDCSKCKDTGKIALSLKDRNAGKLHPCPYCQ